MNAHQSLGEEFDHETRVTRRHFERLPEHHLDWRPHAKSFTLRDLASHVVECTGWAELILTRDAFDVDPRAFTPFRAESVAHLLAALDEKAELGRRALAAVTDVELQQPWRLTVGGRVRLERPKSSALRDFALSHLIHHRGQLSVYLRLLDVPVPGSYGPTADDHV